MSGTALPSTEVINKFRDLLETWHRGEEHAIKSPDIEGPMHLRGIHIRAMMNYLNKRGVWVVSSTHGYFFAIRETEKAAYLQNLDSRIKGIQNRKDGLTVRSLDQTLAEMEGIRL